MLKGLMSGISRWLEDDSAHKRRAPRVAQPALVVVFSAGILVAGRLFMRR